MARNAIPNAPQQAQKSVDPNPPAFSVSTPGAAPGGPAPAQTHLVDNLGNAPFTSRPLGPNFRPQAMRGGSGGVIPSRAPNRPAQLGQVVGSALRPERADAPRAREFRVVNGGMYAQGGMKLPMRAGKIVTDGAYDIEDLVAQGIVLEAINPPPEPPLAAKADEPAEAPAKAASV